MKLKNFWKKSFINKLALILGFVFFILAIFFAFYDLTISKFLFDKNSQIGLFVQNFGEIPGLLGVLFFLFIFGTNSKIGNKTYQKIFFSGEILLSTFLFFYILKLIFGYYNFKIEIFSLFGFSFLLALVLISLLGFYLFKQKFYSFSKKNYLASKLTLILFLISGIIIKVLKFLWGRIRFRDLQEGFSNFTPWYFPNLFGGGDSFPSGHAFLGWMLLPLILIAINKKGFKKWGSIFGIIFWGLLISFGRIIIGAHYASDVLFSGFIVISIFLFLYKKYFSKNGELPTRKIKKRK